MDLALNNQQKLIYHKTQPTNQPNVKTVLFQAIQFSISTHFNSICSIDRILSGATIPGKNRPGAMAEKGYSAFPKAPTLMEPHHQNVLVSYTGHSLREEALLLCRDAVGVFYIPSWMGLSLSIYIISHLNSIHWFPFNFDNYYTKYAF